MPRPLLNFFIAFVTGGKIAPPGGKIGSRQLKIDQGEEEKEQQIETGKGAINYLPEELVIESILARLPVQTLAVCCCISKLWYNTILTDTRFAVIHYIQNKSKLSLVFNLLNVSRGGRREIYFFSLLGREKVDMTTLLKANVPTIYETVGVCNGLTCLKLGNGPDYTRGLIAVFNPNRGSSPFPSGTITKVSRMLCRQATFCGGDLFWRTKNKLGNNDAIEMLLSFDLHNEKIHFVPLPTECTSTAARNARRYLADDHLLEYKGYPCIARSERITTRSTNNDHCGHHCNYRTGVCCCCYEVHMYLLKDKEQQVWTREETLDVQIMDQEGLLPTPLCCCFKRKTTPLYRFFGTSAATPPTRILTFSNQVLVYWFNGERLILYNLQEKHLKVVECSRSYPGVFREGRLGADEDIHCPSMDYQLYAQEENIISLKTFIPKEAKRSECHSDDELMHLFDNNLAKGWLSSRRKPSFYFVFS